MLGIDQDKCIKCLECIKDCPAFLYHEDESGAVIHDDPTTRCIRCGHCIAVCPEDAVLHEGMGEIIEFDGVEHPEDFVSPADLLKALQSLRVVRRYKQEKVPKELLDQVINAMKYAPTGANIRAEKLTVISDPEKLEEVSDAIRAAIESDDALNDRFSRTFKLMEEEGHNLVFNAPHLIIVHTQMPMNMNFINLGNIITYGRLMAQSLGLGTCYHGWTQLALQVNPKLKRLLKTSGKTACAFTLGYPDVKYHRVPPRAPMRVKKI